MGTHDKFIRFTTALALAGIAAAELHHQSLPAHIEMTPGSENGLWHRAPAGRDVDRDDDGLIDGPALKLGEVPQGARREVAPMHRQSLVRHVNALAASVMRGGDAGELVQLVQRVVSGAAAADAARSARARLARQRRAARRKRLPDLRRPA